MELQDHDPYVAIGGASEYTKFATRARTEKHDRWRPVMDAFHTFDDMVLRYEIPGVLPDDIEVRVDGRVLWVLGERRAPEPVPEELSLRSQRTFGAFDGSIALPQGTDPGGVRATYVHGVLEIRVAHVVRPAPLDVDVEVGVPETTFIEVLGL